jgi:LuxR family maltose regulon positive regulatory protein
MLGYHAYIKSRVTAMQGDTRRAIEFCLAARENVPANSLDLQIDFSITLGYEYFLYGDFINANKILNETIRSGNIARAINNPVAAYCLLARSQVYQGRLHEADDLLQKAAQLIHGASGQYLGVVGLVEVETAALLCEWNDVDAALVRLKRGLDYLPWWGKADDFCLAYITLARIQLARGSRTEAADAIEKAAQLVQTCGVFSEARSVVEAAQVKSWLIQGDWLAVDRWAATLEKRFGSHDPFRYEDELTYITQARVFIAQNELDEAIRLLSGLEESAWSDGRQGRLIDILLLKALALQEAGDTAQADIALTKSLTLAEPSGYVRVFLDEGRPMQLLLAQRLAHTSSSPLRDYAISLLSRFDAEPHTITAAQEKASPTGDLVEPLSQRELEVLHLIAVGRTNQEIARQLIVSPGTVKAHTSSIYRKLDVANRTEAVARARQLGILP